MRREPHTNFLGQQHEAVLPQYKIKVDLRPGDIVLFEGSQWHCNGVIKKNPDSRMSYVLYRHSGAKSTRQGSGTGLAAGRSAALARLPKKNGRVV